MNTETEIRNPGSKRDPKSETRTPRFVARNCLPLGLRSVLPPLTRCLPCLVFLLAATRLTAAQFSPPAGQKFPFLSFTNPASSPRPAPESGDPRATFFMGRIQYSANNGNDCGTVGQELMKLVSRASTIKVQQEKKVHFTDPDLFETPFLFMNGHSDFVLSAEELVAMRKYFEHGGFLFVSGCCTNPKFPTAARREFARIFQNETVRELPYDHPIYRSFYLITGVRSLHENKDIHLEGLFYQGSLVMVMCEDGLCCAFSMENRCNQGKGVSPEDGQKLALNIAIYSLTH